MTYEKEDFLDFKFGDHWASEYGLIRVSNSKRYDANVTPTLTDKTTEVPGGDGMYFFSTYHKQRQFTIQVAFDHITESQLRAIRVWLNGKDVQSLIFAEDLDKNESGQPIETSGRQYFAKVTGAPSLKYVPFDEPTQPRRSNNTNAVIPANTISTEVIYKGEGTIQFTCYDPYAYSISQISYGGTGTAPIVGGEVDTPFILTTTAPVANTQITVNNNTIVIPSAVAGSVIWNSKTGIVKNGTTPIAFTGNSMTLLHVGDPVSISSGTITYYNRYY